MPAPNLSRQLRYALILLVLSIALVPCAQGQAPNARRPLTLPPEWQAERDTSPAFRPGEVLVLYEPDMASLPRSQALAAMGASPLGEVAPDLQLVAVAAGQELVMASELSALPGVVAAEPNYRVWALGSPDDPLIARQWHHSIIRAHAAWELITGSEAVTIAVIDSGADLTHPDLAARLVAGRDYVEMDDDPRDRFGHGTHVAGLIGAVTDNGAGIAGVDWQARLLIIRALNAAGIGYVADIVQAIDYAIAQGADVINLSLGGPQGGTLLQPAIDRAYAAGVVVVAAMGNDATGTPYYPAACEHVIAVSATTRDDVYALYSNYGYHVDLAAPGGQWASSRPDAGGIYSTMPTYSVTANLPPDMGYGMDYDYDYWQGTSMSAALVSGLSALLLSANPSLSPEELEDIMRDTAVDLGPSAWDQDYGWGRIDLATAVAMVAPGKVHDLRILQVSPTGDDRITLDLAWTPPRNASDIEIRRSTALITADTWASAAVVAQGLPPDTSSLTLVDLPYTGGTVHLALRAESVHRPGELWSPVSNNAFWPIRGQHLLPLVMVGQRASVP